MQWRLATGHAASNHLQSLAARSESSPRNMGKSRKIIKQTHRRSGFWAAAGFRRFEKHRRIPHVRSVAYTVRSGEFRACPREAQSDEGGRALSRGNSAILAIIVRGLSMIELNKRS